MIRSSRGISLVNIVVALGIGSIVMLGFASSMQLMTKSKNSNDMKVDASTFVDDVMQAVHKPDQCARNMGSGANVLDQTGGESIVHFGLVGEGSMVGQKAKIAKMRMKMVNPSSWTTVAGTNLKATMARMELVMADTSTNPPTILRSRFIPMKIVYDSSSMVTGCSMDDSQAQICAQMNGVWDASAPAGFNCMPTDHCLHGGNWAAGPVGGYTEGSPNPGFINTFTGSQSCPANFSAQQTGTINVARKASKYHVAIDTYGVYTCIRCRAPVVDQGNAGQLSSADLDPSGEGYADSESANATNEQYRVTIGDILRRLRLF